VQLAEQLSLLGAIQAREQSGYFPRRRGAQQGRRISEFAKLVGSDIGLE
jgi:hypothetical protein